MNVWIIIWLFFWICVMGLPIYLFKKYKITLYEKSWQHTIFYIFSLLVLLIVYRNYFADYFSELPLYPLIAVLLFFWFFISVKYKNDYYSEEERFNYQLPKFFEIVYQQLCFLGGLLTFGTSPVVFGLIFFAVHTPFVFFVPKKFAFFVTGGSLGGGLIFAYLQSQGVLGFLISFFLHLSFWFVFHYMLTKKYLVGVVPIKR